MEAIIIIIFVIGYIAITMEHKINLNKAASALITAALCWTVIMLNPNGVENEIKLESLSSHLGEVAGILFFLMSAMTIVELIDAHDGFDIVTNQINTKSKTKLVWIIGILAFFLSAVLDNLTTTIVLVSLIKKIIPNRNDKLVFIGMVVIAANAGGAWSPIGDVSTTMLWIGGQISASNVILKTFLASFTCFALPTFIISKMFNGTIETENNDIKSIITKEKKIIFWSGLSVLLFVPIFKTITHLPPYIGILLGLGIIWLISELVHKDKDDEIKDVLTVNYALKKIDTPSILFFLGILLAVASLQEMNLLKHAAQFLDNYVGNLTAISLIIGVLSAIVDNVPIVAAVQQMYTFPQDHYFWEFMAYCAGTGGSILIIGSAAGVAAMGLEKIEFFWYLKKIGWLALIGYLAGTGVFILQNTFFHT
ncbi:MAG: sodium:proton antiporter NhaD [Chitinophagaceae bacterium]|nr:sodium:proton antiporter NhaD [Chitinophagaceae bacterium]